MRAHPRARAHRHTRCSTHTNARARTHNNARTHTRTHTRCSTRTHARARAPEGLVGQPEVVEVRLELVVVEVRRRDRLVPDDPQPPPARSNAPRGRSKRGSAAARVIVAPPGRAPRRAALGRAAALGRRRKERGAARLVVGDHVDVERDARGVRERDGRDLPLAQCRLSAADGRRCRCGGAGVGGVSPVPAQMWPGVSPVPVQKCQGASPFPAQMWWS